MVIVDRLYKTSAGFFCGCLICFLVAGCGGKADTPKEQKKTQGIVRQKIPAAEQKVKNTTAGKKQDKTMPVKAVPISAPKGKKVGPSSTTQQSVPSTSAKVSTQAEPEKTAAVDQQQTAPDTNIEPLSPEEKKAAIDEITREAQKGITENVDVPESAHQQEKPELADQEKPSAEEVGGNLTSSDQQMETEEKAPVIDLGTKETSEEGDMTMETGEQAAKDALFNPFSPLFTKNKGLAVEEMPSIRQRRGKFLTPLEKIDIGQLTLKGIIMAQSGNRAVLVDARGKGYVVKEGSYVGLNSGTVDKVESDRIDVVETIGMRQSKTVLKLQKPAGE